MTRGSRSYGSLVSGSYTSQERDSVGLAANGSMKAVAGSGKTSMSDELIALQPRIDEPSKPRPSVKTDSVSSETGTAKCCQVPRMSHSLRSTILTSLDLARLITSLDVMVVALLVGYLGRIRVIWLLAAGAYGAQSNHASSQGLPTAAGNIKKTLRLSAIRAYLMPESVFLRVSGHHLTILLV